jgi:hypothetical protein
MKRLSEFLTPDRSLRISFSLFLAAVPSFVFFRTHHFGMYGHIEKSMGFWDHASDYFWWFGFGAGTIPSFRSEVVFSPSFHIRNGGGFSPCS